MKIESRKKRNSLPHIENSHRIIIKITQKEKRLGNDLEKHLSNIENENVGHLCEAH